MHKKTMDEEIQLLLKFFVKVARLSKEDRRRVVAVLNEALEKGGISEKTLTELKALLKKNEEEEEG